IDLRYWGEAFMYAVHIQNLSPTSGLEKVVPYEAWTGSKPNVSHLRVFRSIGYANIPKKLRGGKLEATAVKCRLLGWWTDETKGYRLQEIESGKLIASRDVKFVENDAPSDLVIIESEKPIQSISELVSDDLETSREPQKPGTTEIATPEQASSIEADPDPA